MAGKEWSSGLWVELGLTTLQKKKKKISVFCRWKCTFGFHKRRGISCLAERLLASQEGLCSMLVEKSVAVLNSHARVRQHFC
jgi:hypothetical protein